jgi:malate:Na+ symporter
MKTQPPCAVPEATALADVLQENQPLLRTTLVGAGTQIQVNEPFGTSTANYSRSVPKKSVDATAPSVMERLKAAKVGPLPVPVYIILFGVIYAAAMVGKLPADMIGGFAVIMIMGWLLGDVGMKVPILKDIGGPAILSMFVPSILLFYNLINSDTLKAITAVMKTSNFLYLYISCLVCGSILGMARVVLIQGFLRMFIPLTVGTIAAVAAGVSVGLLFGYDVKHTFFYIITPIVGGGIGEGILPYSMAMAEILKHPQAEFIPQLVPAAMLGNVVAIMSCGFLKKFGEKHPKYNGNGLLVKTGDDKALRADMEKSHKIEFSLMGAGMILACSFFIFGGMLSKYIGIPGAIIMILSAALVKVSNIMPAKMQEGAYQMYRFIATNLTWPLLVGLGVLFCPWKDVVAAVTPAYIAICTATVLAMVTSGFFVAKLMNMYEVEAAIVTACHSGLGGTGDVAILSSANRMELMPFAQVSTRIGGALMIIVATVLLKMTV